MTLTPPSHVLASLQSQLGRSWAELLAPIEASTPAGASLRHTPLYPALQQARSADDATLPMGAWQHELKHADWPAVQQLTTEALCRQSKDLQFAVWLLEARMQQQGLAGIAPCLWLMAGLLDAFWDGLHPLPQGRDLSHRANLLRWVNRRLLAPLKLIPLTAAGPEREFSWADLEHAQRREQLRASARREATEPEPAGTGPDLAALQAALAATPASHCSAQHDDLAEALAALAALTGVIDQRFDEDAPSLGAFDGAMHDMRAWLGQELKRRGLPLQRKATAVAAPVPAPAAPGEPPPAAPPPRLLSPPAEREQAYAMLAAACDTLRRIEPHSPVPYVVQRAIAWGGLNTAELYMELFVRTGGQINIFELLGIAAAQPADPQPAAVEPT